MDQRDRCLGQIDPGGDLAIPEPKRHREGGMLQIERSLE
jgi:hypothetical protein